MKRKVFINKLLAEGFSEKTLMNFTDKQLKMVCERMTTTLDAINKNPKLKQLADDPETEIEVESEVSEDITVSKKVEVPKKKVKKDDNKEKKSDNKKSQKKDEIKEWVKTIAESKFTTFTSKKDILNIIGQKINESEVVENTSEVVEKTSENKLKIPEFMTYDAISKSESQPSTAPAPTKNPTTKPGTKPTPAKNPRQTPFQPKNPNQPAVNPGPKAGLRENKKGK